MQVDFTTTPNDSAANLTKREYFAALLFVSFVASHPNVSNQTLARLAIDGAHALITEINEVSMEVQNALGVAYSPER